MTENVNLRPMKTGGLLNCRWCKADLRGKTIHYAHFFHCSVECKKAERKGKLEKAIAKRRRRASRLATAATKKKTPDTSSVVRKAVRKASEPVKLNKDGTPRKSRVETKPRVCGKCGQPGHNARTCKDV